VLAALMALPGLIAFLRFLIFYMQGNGGGHIQSLVIAAALIAAGTVTMVGGLLADLVAANRVLLAEIRSRILASELERADYSKMASTPFESSHT
jgi:hypothetical protein